MNVTDRPLISVITVVYNGAATLEATIKSVIAQNFTNIEYIVIDGGSKDGTVNILQQYDKEITYWESAPDKGIYDAMNKGLLHTKGDFVFFLGADDVLKTEHTFADIAPFLTNKGGIYYGNVLFKTRNVIYDGKFHDFKFCLRNISHQALFYPRAAFDELSFNTKYKLLADYVLNLQLKAKKYKFVYIDQCITLYNDEGASGTSEDVNFKKDRMVYLKQAFPIYIVAYAYIRSKIKSLLK